MPQIFDPIYGNILVDPMLGEVTIPQQNLVDRSQLGVPTPPVMDTGNDNPNLQVDPASLRQNIGSSGGGISTEGFDPAMARERRNFADEAVSGLAPQDQAELGAIADSAFAANDQTAAMRGEAQKGVNRATGLLTEAQGRGYDEIGIEQAQMAIDAATEEQQFRNDIDQSLAKWQQVAIQTASLNVDPDRLIKNAGAGGRLGLAASAFADVFLQPRGIKVGAIDNIKERINQDINSQITDIEQGRWASSQFRSFYEAARQTAVDGREVREKLNNMVLSSLENKVKAKIAGAQSELDRANGQQMLTEIQAAKIESDAKITQYTFEQAQARRQAREELRVKWANVANERRALDWQQSPLNPANAKRAAIDPPAMVMSPLVNPESGQADPIAVLRPEFKDQAFKVQEEIGDVAGMMEEGRALRDRIKAYGSRVYKGPVGDRIRSEEAQNLYKEYMQYFNKYRKFMTGAAGTNTEDKRYEEALSLPTLLGSSAAESVHAFNHQLLMGIRAQDRKISGYHDPRYGKYQGFAEAWKKEAEDYEKPVETSSEADVERVRVKNLAAAGYSDKASTEWQDYAKAAGHTAGGIGDINNPGYRNFPQNGRGKFYDTSSQPDWAAAMDERMYRALNGDQQAKEFLQVNAGDPDLHPNRRAYANFLLMSHPELQVSHWSDPVENGPVHVTMPDESLVR